MSGHDDPPGYWFETDRRIAVETFHDQRAARAMNADRLLEHEAEKTHE